MKRDLLTLIIVGGLLGCAVPYTPISKSTLAKAPGAERSQLAAVATKDTGLTVRAVDGQPVETAVVYIEPGQHVIDIELTRVYAIELGSGPKAYSKDVSVQLAVNAGHSYAILAVTDQQFSSIEIYADDNGENYDVECFFWHRLEIPAQHFPQCKDPVVENGIMLPPSKRLTAKSVKLWPVSGHGEAR